MEPFPFQQLDPAKTGNPREPLLKIEIGFDIPLQRLGPAPIILALQLRPEEEHRLERQTEFSAWPLAPITHQIDAFGNRRIRLVQGSGPLRLHWRGTVQDEGLPDQRDSTALQSAIHDLPEDAMQFQLPSRYCQSDLIMTEAWSRFGHLSAGWARVQAVCDFVHIHIEFGYGYANVTKSAIDVLQQGRGVCRDLPI